MRCDIAKLFGVMPYELKRLPLSEFRVMYRYWAQIRAGADPSFDITSDEPKDGIVIE